MNRYESIGIKQTLHLELMNRALDLLLDEFETKAIRADLMALINNSSSNQDDNKRSKQTAAFALTNLMNTWITPSPELIPLRNDLLVYCRNSHVDRMAAHWAMVSASYPFWFNVSRQVGRLFSLQDIITQSQITSRLKEQYGDRQTVSRFGRYVIRSFVNWGVMGDTETSGCYIKSPSIKIESPKISQLMIEAALLAIPEGRCALDALYKTPAFFPFQFTIIPKSITIGSTRLETSRYNLDHEMISIRH